MFVVLLIATALYGCGTERAAQQKTTAAVSKTPREQVTKEQSHRNHRRCSRAGRLVSGPLTFCLKHTKNRSTGSFWVRRRRGPDRLRVKHPFGRTNGAFHGSWVWAAASPDGKTVLAQFSGECEIPMAFFVPASGGVASSVSGPYTRGEPPENSSALGWTTDGRAIVFIPAAPGCGSTHGAGVFLIAPSGETEKVASIPPRHEPKLERSLRARSVASIKRALSMD